MTHPQTAQHGRSARRFVGGFGSSSTGLATVMAVVAAVAVITLPGCKNRPSAGTHTPNNAIAAPGEPHTVAELVAGAGQATDEIAVMPAGAALAAAYVAASATPVVAPAMLGGRRSIAAPVPTPPRRRRAVGHKAAVATAHPLATQAALQTLAAGGNAVDAFVAASFMLSVVTPQSTGIGGGGFAVVWPSASEPAVALDFREQAPAAGRLEQYLDATGHAVAERSRRHGLAVGVPGYVAGLAALHKRWGKRPWASLVLPAVQVAERGFVMGDVLVAAAQSTWPVLHPNARILIGTAGHAPEQGRVLRQPALAQTLRRVGLRGPAGFYAGPVAADIVDTVRAAGGHLSLADLKGYRPRWRKPLAGRVLGLDVLTMPQPSAGGAQLLAMAEMMHRFVRAANPTRHIAVAHALTEAMRRAFQLRLAYSGDTATPATRLDDVYPAKVRAALAATFDPTHASKSARRLPGKLEGHNNTSHLSIIDGSGMAVASTHTVNLLFGSGIVTAKTGVWLNNELDDFSFTLTESNAFGLAGSTANLFRPGARPVSSMTPTIFLKDGQPALIIGSPGGTRIPTAVFQVAWRTLVAHQPLQAAIDAPRLHHQAFPNEVWVETGAGEAAWRKGLEALGHHVVAKAPWCDVQAVRVTRDKAGKATFEAVSDGRAEGTAGAR